MARKSKETQYIKEGGEAKQEGGRREIRKPRDYSVIVAERREKAQQRREASREKWSKRFAGMREKWSKAKEIGGQVKDYVYTIPERVVDRVGQAGDISVVGKDIAVEKTVQAGQAVKGGVEAAGRGIRTGVEAGIGAAEYGIEKTVKGGKAAYEMGQQGVEATIDALERGKDATVKAYNDAVETIQRTYKEQRDNILNGVDMAQFKIKQKQIDRLNNKIDKLTGLVASREEVQMKYVDKIDKRNTPEVYSMADLGESGEKTIAA